MIASFQGRYRFLSNFWPCTIEYKGIIFPSTENAYQAAKNLNPIDWAQFTTCGPGEAKRLSRKLPIRKDWDKIKLSVMAELTIEKYAVESDLADRLVQTYPHELVEGNTWHDYFWGVCAGRGENNLGKLLMARREYLRTLS
jgi:ribA/ribD-fused uncharacterized protein